MPQRVTFVIEDKLMAKLRNVQAKKLRDSHQSVSFSKLLNDILENSMKKK